MSSRMTWSSVEESRLGHRKLFLHMQATCVPHKLYSVGEDKPRLRSDEASKVGKKCIWGLGSPQGLS